VVTLSSSTLGALSQTCPGRNARLLLHAIIGDDLRMPHTRANSRYELKLRLFKPKSASGLQSFLGWLTGMPAEFSDPRLPSYSEGREGALPANGWMLDVVRLVDTPP
jgi:hypothetical protein